MKTVAVVGGSIAAVRTVEGIRAEGFDGRLVLVSDERHWPYDRPPLSKRVLVGGDGAVLLDEGAASALRLDVRLGAAAVALRERTLLLADGGEIAFDACVVATGASALRPPWSLSSGLHTLRGLDDALCLREDLARASHVVTLGAGFVGAEVAATARARGVEVTMLDRDPAPLGRLLHPCVTSELTRLHARHGVTTRFGVGVRAARGAFGDVTLELDDGSVLRADAVVAGIGARPNVAWLGLGTEGLLADEHGRVRDRLWTVGDVARWREPGSGRHRVSEHWTSAVEQAAVVAHNVVRGAPLRAHHGVDYVWSDQHDWRLQLLGRTRGASHRQVGSFEGAGARGAFLFGDASLEGLVAVNWPRAVVQARRLLGTPIDAAVDALTR